MKKLPSCIAILLFTSVLACGEPEGDVDDGVVLLDPESAETETITTASVDMSEPAAEEIEPGDILAEPPPTPVTGAQTPIRSPAPASATKKEEALTPPPVSAEPVKVVTPVKEAPPARTEPAPSPPPDTATREPEPAATPASSKLPKTHTVNKEGTMHAPGLDTPTAKCGACHGKDLQGGRVGVSCFDCHDQQWD